jgi:hypothetical protein
MSTPSNVLTGETAVSSYDLSAQARAWNKAQLPGRLFVLALVVLFFAFTLPLVFRLAAVLSGQAWNPTEDDTALLAACLVWPLVAFGLWGSIFLMGPAATALEVRGERLEFSFPRGRRRTVSLSDSGVRLTLEDLSEALVGRKRDSTLAYRVMSGFRTWASLTPESFRAILDAARQAGLDPRRVQSPWWRGSLPSVVYYLRTPR